MRDLKIFRFLILATILGLSACGGGEPTYLTANDPGTATIKIFKNNNSTSKNRYIAPKDVSLSQSYQTLNNKLTSQLSYFCPSIGDVNLLVIPVKTPGDKNDFMTDQKRNLIKSDIEKAFFGDLENKGYKSVKDYYAESSFNKISLGGFVTDWFDLKENTSVDKYSKMTGSYEGTIANEILLNAVEWAKTTYNLDLKDYDKNNDGAIDAVYLIYDEFDVETQVEYELSNYSYYDENNLNQSLKNITFQTLEGNPNPQSEPIPVSFSWISFASLYKGYAKLDNLGYPVFDDLLNNKLSTQQLIHEQGHLFGLEDYSSETDSNYHPIGKHSMMDMKTCDLDSHSKMLLGWVTPYVVYGTSEILLPKANFSDNCVIVIPSNFEKISDEIEIAIKNEKIHEFHYEFNPFSEYLMIDLYTPDGLNYEDAFGTKLSNYPEAPTGSGVRIYHVDNRIFKATAISSDLGVSFNYVDEYEWNEKELSKNQVIMTPITNSRTENSVFQLPQNFDYFDRIRLIESTQINTFNEGGWVDYSTFFKKNSNPFEIENFGYRFFNANYSFNNGNSLPFKISIETLKEVNL